MATTLESGARGRLAQFLHDADFHGLKRSLKADASVWSRVFWVLVFAGSMGFMCSIIFVRITTYYSFQVTSRFFQDELRTQNFPSVTLCNHNTVRRNLLTSHDFLHMGHELFEMSEDMKLLEPEYFQDDPAFVKRVHETDWAAANASLPLPFDYGEFINRTSGGPRATIKAAYFGPVWWPVDDRIVATHPPPTADYQACATLDTSGSLGRPQLNSTVSNIEFPMAIFVNVAPDEYSWNSDKFFASPVIWYELHEPGTYSSVADKGDMLRAGLIYTMKVRGNRVVRLPAPFSDCAPEGSRVLRFMPAVSGGAVTKYSKRACMLECDMEAAASVCHCRWFWQPGELPICSLKEDRERFDKTMFEIGMMRADPNTAANVTKCDCPTECDVTTYSVKMNPVYPNPHKTDWDLEIDKGFLMYMYFDTLWMNTVVEEPAFPLTALISDMGGNMGLFIGASVLTLLHMLEYVLSEVSHCLGRSRSPVQPVSRKLNVLAKPPSPGGSPPPSNPDPPYEAPEKPSPF